MRCQDVDRKANNGKWWQICFAFKPSILLKACRSWHPRPRRAQRQQMRSFNQAMRNIYIPAWHFWYLSRFFFLISSLVSLDFVFPDSRLHFDGIVNTSVVSSRFLASCLWMRCLLCCHSFLCLFEHFKCSFAWTLFIVSYTYKCMLNSFFRSLYLPSFIFSVDFHERQQSEWNVEKLK